VAAGIATVTGGTAADSITKTAAGAMTLDGGAGDDVFTFSTAAIFAADSVDGGTGSNSVVLTTDAQTVADADFDRIEAGTIQALTTANGANSLTLAANAVAAGIATVTGGTAADSITKTAAGAMTLDGGAGDDVFTFSTAAIFAADSVDGGTGSNSVVLTTDAQTVGDADFDRIEAGTIQALTTANGVNSITLAANAVAAGIVSVFGGTGADTFDASHAAYNATGVYFNGGGGADDLTGGGSTDTFVFATQAALAAAAAINGSGGNDTISLTTQGQAILDTNFANVSAGSVEALAFANGTGSSAVLAGTADTAGIASVYGGSGNDTLTVDETIYTAPTFHGADGTDVLILSNDAATLVDTFFTDVDSVVSFQTANGANDITLGLEATGAGIATVTGGTGADILNASAMTSAVTLMGGTGADTLTGGTNGSRLQGWALSGVDNTWNDSLTGGGGVDTFVLGNSGANAYGQFSSGNASNKVAFITGFTVGSDRFELFANGVNIGTPSSTFTNNGADQITITKTAGSTGYVLSYDDSINTAQLYVNGTSRLVAEISYTGDFADVANNNNGMFSFV
jgi:hypothetical protein